MYLESVKNQNNSKAIIMFHAFTGSPTDVISVGRGLAKEGYTVYLPTLSGHNTNDPDDLLKYGVADWVKDGAEAYQTLINDGFTDISVFGLSLGGIVATDVMLHNKVKSYGVFSSPVLPDRANKVPANFWMMYKFYKKKAGLSEDEIKERRREVMNQLDIVLGDIQEHLKMLMPEYSYVETPVFIGQGGKDEMVDPTISKDFRDALTNAEVDFHWYEGAPHVITTGRAGKETQKDLLAFLEKNAQSQNKMNEMEVYNDPNK